VSLPARSDDSRDGPVPYSRLYFAPDVYVGTAAVAGASLLFNATTYSRCCLRSIRENAYTPGPAEESRLCCTPSRSAGCRSVTEASAAIDLYSGCDGEKFATACVELVPSRSSSRYSGTRDANSVCRASWSPPGPVKPCSSP